MRTWRDFRLGGSDRVYEQSTAASTGFVALLDYLSSVVEACLDSSFARFAESFAFSISPVIYFAVFFFLLHPALAPGGDYEIFIFFLGALPVP